MNESWLPKGPRIVSGRALRSMLPAVLLVGLVLSACMPLYLPPVPDPPPYEAGTRISSSSTELATDGHPLLNVTLTEMKAAGWLAIQWMAPSGREAASESVWLEPDHPSAVLRLPDDVELVAGEWRAVVSFGQVLLRQFTFVVE